MPRRRQKILWGFIAGFLIFAFLAPAIGWLLGRNTPTANRVDLLVVYDDKTRSAAKALAEFLEGLNLTVELRPASDFKVHFRAYPAVLVAPTADLRRLDQLGITRVLVRGPEGAPMLAYDVVLQLLQQLDARGMINGTVASYYANMTLYVIEGESPAARLAKSDKTVKTLIGLIPLFESLFAAQMPVAISILNVTQARAKGIPVDQLPVLPAVVAESDANLTQGTLMVLPLGDRYYTLNAHAAMLLAQLLAQNGVAEGYEYATEPPNTTGLIRVGEPGAPVEAVVYWDFLCPYSARFDAEIMPVLARLAENGTLTLYFADLLVHPQAFRLHQIGHCVYEKYGPEKYLEYAHEAFRAVTFAANATKLEEYANELAEKYGVAECEAQLADGDAQRLGVTGTPTLVAWSKRYDRLVFIVGVHPAGVYTETIEWLAGR